MTAVVRNYVAPVLSSAPGLDGKKELALMLDNTEGIETVEIGLTDRAGITRSARVSLSDAAQTSEGRLLSVPLGSLVLPHCLYRRHSRHSCPVISKPEALPGTVRCHK